MAELARHPQLWVLTALDAAIVLYAVGLALSFLTRGLELGVVSLHGAAKPLLLLLVLVPTRIAIGRRSWLADLVQQAGCACRTALANARGRVPPAISDTLFAIVTVSAASLAAAFVANLVFAPAMARGFTLPFQAVKFAEVFAAWDSGWYWDIATRGYYFRTDAQSSVAFFPLYPMLMRAVAMPFGGGAAATWVAGIVVSLAAYVMALVAIHRFAERIFDSRDVARRTVLYIAVFPWSFFMTRVYAESVFLLMTVLAISRADEERWWEAGLWAGLATLTRPNGFLIAVPLALLALRGTTSWRDVAARWMAIAPVPVAFAGFCAYVYTLTGDPLAWMSAQAHWGYSLGNPPWQQLQRLLAAVVEHGPYGYFFSSEIALFELLHGATAIVFVALTPLVFSRLGAAMGAYVLVSLLLPLSSNTLEGLGRYVSVLFPAFMLVASVASDRLREGIVVVSLTFRTLLVCLLVTWQPIY